MHIVSRAISLSYCKIRVRGKRSGTGGHLPEIGKLGWGYLHIHIMPRDLHSTRGQHDRASCETEPLLRRSIDIDSRMTSPAQEASRAETGADAALARRVVKKIDRVVIPLLFVTYMLNFMDKVILSSAAVFGLRDDTVRSMPSTIADFI